MVQWSSNLDWNWDACTSSYWKHVYTSANFSKKANINEYRFFTAFYFIKQNRICDSNNTKLYIDNNTDFVQRFPLSMCKHLQECTIPVIASFRNSRIGVVLLCKINPNTRHWGNLCKMHWIASLNLMEAEVKMFTCTSTVICSKHS